jgi:hypothetical protein
MMSIKRRLLVPLGVTVVAILFVSVVTGAASSIINVYNPETPPGEGELPIVAPRLIPPDDVVDYEMWPSGEKIVAPDDRPIAQIVNVSSKFAQTVQTVSVTLPDIQTTRADKIGYSILSSVRYEGNGHIILVTTARPSPAAAQAETVFGSQTLQLTDGSAAWAVTGLLDEPPNQIVFVRDNLIITVASDLSIDDLQALAKHVIVAP